LQRNRTHPLTLPVPQPIAAAVDQDPSEPGPESIWIAQRSGPLPGDQAGVLDGILGLAVVEQDGPGEGKGAVELELDPSSKRASYVDCHQCVHPTSSQLPQRACGSPSPYPTSDGLERFIRFERPAPVARIVRPYCPDRSRPLAGALPDGHSLGLPDDGTFGPGGTQDVRANGRQPAAGHARF
jgi:hypothetical protein